MSERFDSQWEADIDALGVALKEAFNVLPEDTDIETEDVVRMARGCFGYWHNHHHQNGRLRGGSNE